MESTNMNEMEIIANRKIALYHLRVNPSKRKWGHGKLKDGDRFCALGMMAEALGVDPAPDYPSNNTGGIDWGMWLQIDPYKQLEKKLGVDGIFLHYVYNYNDDDLQFKFTGTDDEKFAKAAEYAETKFEECSL